MYRQQFRGPRRPIPRRTWSEAKYVNKNVVAPSDQPAITITHSFADFAIDERLKKNIAQKGYSTPTPIQDQAIPVIVEGRDVVGIANTGTGKTAAFLLPIINKLILDRTQKAIVICPTRELAIQINEELRDFSRGLNVSSGLAIGGESMNRQMYDLRYGPNVVIGTPGRIKDLIERGVLKMYQYQTVVLDEVDRMVDIGFINDIKRFLSLLPKVRQSLFFSATVSREVDAIIQSFLTDPITISVKVAETAHLVEQDIIRVRTKEEKFSKLYQMLTQVEFSKVLIFGRTKWGVERLAMSLVQNGIRATAIHGNKSQGQRVRAIELFKSSQYKVLVATDIAARGLDIPGVSHVINFDEPANYEDYVHRIGRTGRAEQRGKALTFVS